VVMIWENLGLFLVTCCTTVQFADSATFVYTVYHVTWYLPIKF
jgi:hypothetical protein